MVEDSRKPPASVDRLGQVKQAKDLSSEEAFLLCQRIAPSETEDSRLLVVNCSVIIDGFWNEAHGLLGPYNLIANAAEENRTNQVISEIQRTYYSGETSGKRELFEQVYKVVRRYMRENRKNPKL